MAGSRHCPLSRQRVTLADQSHDQNLTEYAYDTGSDLSMIPYIIYIVLGVALLTVVCTFLSIYRAFTKSSPVEATGFIGPVILSAIVLVIVWFTNAAVRSETDGWIDSIILLKVLLS